MDNFIKSSILLSGLISFGVQANSVPTDCDTSGFTLNGIFFSTGDPNDPSSWTNGDQIWDGGLDSTKCAGVFTDPSNDDQGGLSDPYPNLGYAGDGLLNGEDGIIPGDYFFSPGQTLVDMPGGIDYTGTDPQDPGWFHLANIQYDNQVNYSDSALFDAFELDPSDPNYVDIDMSSLVKLDIGFDGENGMGTWSLILNPDIVSIVQSEIKANAFDHLAFSVKAGSDKSGGGFVIYDFDFDVLIDYINENADPEFDFITAYNFYGTFDTSDLDFKEYSHINVWARDPVASSVVPLPGAVWLFGSALLGFLGIKRFKKSA